jgi:hypothetical protein
VKGELLDLAAGVVFALQLHPANPAVGRADDEHHGVLPGPPEFDVTRVLDREDFRPVLAGREVGIDGFELDVQQGLCGLLASAGLRGLLRPGQDFGCFGRSARFL